MYKRSTSIPRSGRSSVAELRPPTVLSRARSPLVNGIAYSKRANGPSLFSEHVRPRAHTTASEDVTSQSLEDHHITECGDEQCAFGVMTYVCDHVCKRPKSSGPQSIWRRVSIHTLLHEEKGKNPLLDDYVDGTIRHVHLPANNMAWVQVILRNSKDGKP